ncbi:MAG: endolytic transglycosylase MltG [Galbitalea sp.]
MRGGAGVVYAAFGPQIRHVMGWEPSVDYSGSGNGQAATIVILPGQFGAAIADSLAKAGVTKTSAAFYDLLLKQKKAPNLEPGTYKLQKQMSAQAALTALLNPASRVVSKIVIPEGYSLPQILARISSQTGLPLTELQTEAKNYTQFGVPAAAPSLEGFLFPATYTFDPGTPAKTILQAMVTRMNQSLTSHGVAPADDLKVLTLASIIQKEGGTTADFYKVSRVFTNRLAINMPPAVRRHRELRGGQQDDLDHGRAAGRCEQPLQHLRAHGACRSGRSRRRAIPRSMPRCIRSRARGCTSSS